MTPELDFEASAAKLAEWLAGIKATATRPKDEAREYRALAARLAAVAEALDEPQWWELEAEFDRPETGLDGYPIPNAGRYRAAIRLLGELSDVAAGLADDLPTERKPELGWAAAYFLHLWLETRGDRPTLSNNSEAASAFGRILEAGGYVLSPERVRGILADALRTFDPTFHPCGSPLEAFFVYRP